MIIGVGKNKNLTFAGIWVAERQPNVVIKVFLTTFTVDPFSVVFTIAYTAILSTIGEVQMFVELATVRVAIALTPLTLVGIRILGRHPFSIVIQRETLFAIVTIRMVFAHAFRVYHALNMLLVVMHVFGSNAPRRMSVTEASPDYLNVLYSVVVFVDDVVLQQRSGHHQLIAEHF